MYLIGQEITIRIVQTQEKPGGAFIADVCVGRYQSLFGILEGSHEEQGRQLGLAVAHLMKEQDALQSSYK